MFKTSLNSIIFKTMGQIQTIFRRQTRAEKLDLLETGIREKEKEKLHTGRHQAVVKRFVKIGTLGVFSLAVILSIFTLVHGLVVLFVPFAYALVRWFISWHYKKKLESSHYELCKMREEKRSVLEDVKSNETYMVAKELLDQYGHPEDQWNQKNISNITGKNSDDEVIVNLL